ncbi:MAG: hypothetical protein KDI68_08155 [Gammaproteobacteria bacterium]|nr:hypothetical protein [Gammaproteobacteria bacterium]
MAMNKAVLSQALPLRIRRLPPKASLSRLNDATPTCACDLIFSKHAEFRKVR